MGSETEESWRELTPAEAAAKAESDRHKREEARSSIGLAEALAKAQAEYLQMRAQGVSREDAVRGIEQVLRDLYPLRRLWRYHCETCQDLGWAIERVAYRLDPKLTYEAAVFCSCRYGLARLEAERQREARTHDVTQAGRTSRRRSGFVRVGG